MPRPHSTNVSPRAMRSSSASPTPPVPSKLARSPVADAPVAGRKIARCSRRRVEAKEVAVAETPVAHPQCIGVCRVAVKPESRSVKAVVAGRHRAHPGPALPVKLRSVAMASGARVACCCSVWMAVLASAIDTPLGRVIRRSVTRGARVALIDIPEPRKRRRMVLGRISACRPRERCRQPRTATRQAHRPPHWRPRRPDCLLPALLCGVA